MNVNMDLHELNEQFQMIEDCENHSARLTDWESKFIDAVSGQDFPLSQKQNEKLKQIWERVT